MKMYSFQFIDPIKISMIGELVLSQDVYTIKVRIIRLWKQTSWNKPQQFHDTDERKEYGDFYIHKLTLWLNQDSIKFVEGSHKMYLECTTKVTKCIDFCGPKTYCAFTDFQTLGYNAIRPKISFG
uniref:DUF223 domain-containing protein n=1 Tax=Lactuca sativa TaxID=4236 RepID=A0A9R1V316_LACSA|nr:hypothetical protein LSAT_V11C700366010 [Lactuca sativa]